MSKLNADLIDEVRERAFEQCMDLATEMVDATLGVGDGTLSRDERIARFVEDAQSGALDVMKVIRPDLYKRAIAEYVRDVGDSPLVNGVR